MSKVCSRGLCVSNLGIEWCRTTGAVETEQLEALAPNR